ncbi:cation-translocating P-type ATPase [Micrococcus antarcticus]|uniref:cation-translocating P-type ATPase n=1 Tax=Micrococcus antarcticus TaxID=86171 RepID=UPI0038513FB9
MTDHPGTPTATAHPVPWTRATAAEALAHFGVDGQVGLNSAEVLRRRAEHGANELEASAAESSWRRFLRQFADPLIHLLAAAVVISVVAWFFEGAHGAPVDAIVIAVIIVFNAVLGYVQEARAADAVAALQGMAAVMATVVRDGRTVQVPAVDVVPGDVLALAEGDSVAADARLIASSSLHIAEAALTGESAPVGKGPAPIPGEVSLGDRANMVHKGTAVTQGVGTAVVTATGMETEMGHIARLLSSTEKKATPLTREIDALGRTLGIAVIGIAVVVMAAIAMTSGIHSVREAVDVLIVGVSLAVAAVPEGLPAILSVVLSLGVTAMSRRNAIVKNLSSVETLGSASVICSDKTGTLTRNEMTLQAVRAPSGQARLSGVGYAPEGRVLLDDGVDLLAADAAHPLREEGVALLCGGSLASNAEVRRDDDGAWSVLGDPTEAAFVVAERKAGLEEARAARFTRVAEAPFTSERKMMSVVVTDGERDGAPLLVAKGAPDVLLQHCTRVRRGDEVLALGEPDRASAARDVQELSDQALRTLAVAYRGLEPAELEAARAADGTLDGEALRGLEKELVFVGTAGIIDPARAEAADAVATARGAGIRVVMITGDHPATALRIAQELGIAEPGHRALSGPELEAMDAEQLRAAVRGVAVYARVSPEHKLRIIGALQADGAIVSMTGDGVNDAPALKKADIGVAMGITGTEVSKEAADMILADDDFATIVAAVRQGRVIFENIKKFLRYLLSSNTGEVLTMFFGVMLAGFLGLTGHGSGVVVPLLATQILWVNLVTDSAPALAMGIDAEGDDVMARPPRRATDRVIDRRMWGGILTIGAVMAAVTLLALDSQLPGGLLAGSGTVVDAQTCAFTTLVLAQLFNALNSRSETTSAFHRMFHNRWLWAAIAFGVLSQVLVVHVPFLQTAFGTTALDAGQWLMCLGLASVVLWFDELRKLVLRARGA